MIYLDNNATTRIADPVFEAMLPYLRDSYGNASSTQHRLGREANHAVENARQQVADVLNCDSKEVYFTSGSTESINAVIKGVAMRYSKKGRHIITSATEHKAVSSTCAALARQGYSITTLPVDRFGQINLADLESAITPETILVCLAWANNETGVLYPLPHIAELCQRKEALLFCDATQYIGKMPFPDLRSIPIDILCFSGHKIHGPKGIGALYIRRKRKPIQIEPLIVGGQQESGWRGGTYHVSGIVGLGAAMREAKTHAVETTAKLRDRLEEMICSNVEEVYINGDLSHRLCNTSNLTIKHVQSSALMAKLHDVAISSGSACVTGSRDPSHVLKAMGLSDEDAFCSVRISLSRYTTHLEIERAAAAICAAAASVRASSPIWQMYREGLL